MYTNNGKPTVGMISIVIMTRRYGVGPIKESHLNSKRAKHFVFILLFLLRNNMYTTFIFTFLVLAFSNTENNTIHSFISSHTGHIRFNAKVFFFNHRTIGVLILYILISSM